jgi:large subunit ribosomal protein L2
MPVKSYRPLTPSTRYITIASFDEITKTKPEKALVYTRKKTGGRNSYGRVTSRGRGQGHKQKVRTVDFRRNKHGIEAKVIAIEYDPIRTARLALLEYKDGEKRYIIAPVGLQVGATVKSGSAAPPDLGNALPLKNVPIGVTIHNLELTPGRGGQMVRSAGGGATLMSRDEGYAQVRLPSGEIRRIHEDCLATVGQVGNTEHENVILGKAGRARHRGIRPLSRGVAKNPVDHPMGGGAGKTSGGGHPVTPWGVITKGFKTRPKFKFSNRFIVVRRDGRPPKVK